ncbi:MAG: hypothetical protein ABIP51_22585 [Bacteroidia bacterium]
MDISSIESWLSSSPNITEIKILKGGKYIPYAIIIDKLYQLCGHEWSVLNFNESYVPLGRRVLVSANLEIEVNYKIGESKIKRKLSGGANFILNKASNPHPTGTIKSLAIMNAVKVLGKQFGWGLNPENEEEKTDFLPVISVEKTTPVDTEKERLLILINECESENSLDTFMLLAKSKGLIKEWNKKLKTLKAKI